MIRELKTCVFSSRLASAGRGRGVPGICTHTALSLLPSSLRCPLIARVVRQSGIGTYGDDRARLVVADSDSQQIADELDSLLV